uniref:Uncharacterized protein n=1 Tax=Anguilla anguilla TaxID=7936 RepID=A0A0E9S9G5_ANGAN
MLYSFLSMSTIMSHLLLLAPSHWCYRGYYSIICCIYHLKLLRMKLMIVVYGSCCLARFE